jgi:hypothetical protein
VVWHGLSACVSPVLQAAWSPVRLGSRDRVDTGLPALVCLPGGVGPGPCACALKLDPAIRHKAAKQTARESINPAWGPPGLASTRATCCSPDAAALPLRGARSGARSAGRRAEEGVSKASAQGAQRREAHPTHCRRTHAIVLRAVGSGTRTRIRSRSSWPRSASRRSKHRTRYSPTRRSARGTTRIASPSCAAARVWRATKAAAATPTMRASTCGRTSRRRATRGSATTTAASTACTIASFATSPPPKRSTTGRRRPSDRLLATPGRRGARCARSTRGGRASRRRARAPMPTRGTRATRPTARCVSASAQAAAAAAHFCGGVMSVRLCRSVRLCGSVCPPAADAATRPLADVRAHLRTRRRAHGRRADRSSCAARGSGAACDGEGEREGACCQEA